MQKLALTRLSQGLIALSIALSQIQCGDDTFNGYNPGDLTKAGRSSDGKKKHKANNGGSSHLDDNGTAVVSQTLLWHWPCKLPDETLLVNDDGLIEAYGTGPHPVRISGGPLTISARIAMCPSNAHARDIVFVVDVSKTARSEDPLSSGTCGRKRAIEGLLDNLTYPESTRVGLVTYDNNTGATVALTDVATFRKDHMSASRLCDARLLAQQHANIASGLSPIKKMLISDGRDSVAKDVFLLTASTPNGSSDGVALASALRLEDVTIMTYQLGNNSAVPAEGIASMGVYDEPLHRHFTSANALANALKDDDALPIHAGVISYKAIARAEWKDVTDMFDGGMIDTYTFEIDGVNLTNQPEGTELRFTLSNEFGRTFVHQGRLEWR